MKETIKDFIILSAYQSDLSDSENINEHETLEYMLNSWGLSFTECEGMYKGQKEKSFLVIIKSFEWLKFLSNLAWYDFNQESVLTRYNNNIFLSFDYNDRTQPNVYFDSLKSVKESEALKSEGYTKRLDTNQYFILQ